MNNGNMIDSCQAHLHVQYAFNSEFIHQMLQCDWLRATLGLHVQNILLASVWSLLAFIVSNQKEESISVQKVILFISFENNRIKMNYKGFVWTLPDLVEVVVLWFFQYCIFIKWINQLFVYWRYIYFFACQCRLLTTFRKQFGPRSDPT